MTFPLVAAVVTAAVALLLTLRLLGAFRSRRGEYHLWWAVGFGLAFASSLLQALAYGIGRWPVPLFRAYLLLSAGVPGFMGAGSMYLIWRRLAAPFLAVILAGEALAVVGGLTTPVRAGRLDQVYVASAHVASAAPGAAIAVAYAVLGSLGALALVVGALVSYVRRRQLYALVIAAGGLAFSLSGTSGAVAGPALFFPAQLLGILLLFWGVALSGGRARPEPRGDRG